MRKKTLPGTSDGGLSLVVNGLGVQMRHARSFSPPYTLESKLILTRLVGSANYSLCMGVLNRIDLPLLQVALQHNHEHNHQGSMEPTTKVAHLYTELRLVMTMMEGHVK